MFLFVANPIDLLAKYANMTEEDMDIEIQEPYNLLKVFCVMLSVVDMRICNVYIIRY